MQQCHHENKNRSTWVNVIVTHARTHTHTTQILLLQILLKKIKLKYRKLTSAEMLLLGGSVTSQPAEAYTVLSNVLTANKG